MKNDSKVAFLIIGIVAISLILLTPIVTSPPFNDVDEYVIIAKHIVGFDNIKIFALHSTLYPLVAAPILAIFKNLLSFQLFTIGIVILTGIAIWLVSKNIKAVLLWAFSALTWYAIGAVGSIIPAALCILLAYCFYEKWNNTNKTYLLAISGLFLGLSSAFYEGAWPVSFFFMLIFFYRRKLSSTLFFLAFFCLGFSARLVTDYLVIGSAFSSTIRMTFANAYVMLGYHPGNKVWITPFRVLEALLIISPLIILSFRIWKKNKEGFLFLILSFIVIGLITPSMMYLYLIMPVSILLLSRVISKKEAIAHIILSIPVIILLISVQFTPKFVADNYTNLNLDIKEIGKDYQGSIIADKDLELTLSSRSWNKNLYFIWLNDYLASKNNIQILKKYEFKETVNDAMYKKMFLIWGDEFVSKEEYPDNLPLIVYKHLKPRNPGYVIEKCYRVICVYRKTA